MKNNIDIKSNKISTPFDILKTTLNTSTQNIHNLIYTSGFYWPEESITTAFLGSIYGNSYSISSTCNVCQRNLLNCQNGNNYLFVKNSKIASFNKIQEGQWSGSDFLFSFEDEFNSEIRFLFQAKTISVNSQMDQSQWNKIFRKGGLQYNKLIGYAKKSQAQAYYMFYVKNRDSHSSARTLCMVHQEPWDTNIVIVEANRLHAYWKIKNFKHSQEKASVFIEKLSYPFTCLFKNHSSCEQEIDDNNIREKIAENKNIFEQKIPLQETSNIQNNPDQIIDDLNLLQITIHKESLTAASNKENAVQELLSDESLPTDCSSKSINKILYFIKNNEVTTFEEIAITLGKPKAAKAVAASVLSQSILPQDAARVIRKSDAKRGYIDSNNPFRSNFYIDNRVNALMLNDYEFDIIIHSGIKRINIGNSDGQAKLITAEELALRISGALAK